MSKHQLVEKAIMSINGAKFQDLCNAYFFWKGYEFITSTGSVIGKEKTRKGTPDAYIPIGNDEYVFIEYTTKERLGKTKSFFKKLSEDIDHCFDQSKSKIKNHQIKKVILCFAEKLKVDEHDTLRKKCATYNCKFEPYGIDQLVRAVLIYPALGSDFLDIPIDTQQILSPPDFISEYEKGKLATSLSNKIYFRTEEINDAISLLKTNHILILTGSPGVGKSRLALEVLDNFCMSNTTFTPICIDNKGCPIHEDIRVYLQKEKNYILLIDDANRATKHYQFILNLLKEKRVGKIKIIVTTRDYASNIIEQLSQDYSYCKVTIQPLEDKQIRSILESDDFKIKNREYSDIIVRVARGNPRLAIMAALVALEKQSLSAFNEIPKIYDSYYDRVVKEINELGDITFLKVLGIVSFFRTIGKEYRNNEKIFETFNIAPNEFWEKVIILHQMELVDLYDDEVVKISDQILGTYFFYKIFIKDKVLDLYTLITIFYQDYDRRFKDVFYPTIDTFGFEHINKRIDKILSKVWDFFYTDQAALLNVFSLFWFFKQDELLNYLSQKIMLLPDSIDQEYIFEEKQKDYINLNSNNIFPILKQFSNYSINDYGLALDLIFLYLRKESSDVSGFVKHIKTHLSFNQKDYNNDYYRQTTLFKKLISGIHGNQNQILFRGVFYHIVNTFLQVTFEHSDGVDRNNSFTIYYYPIPNIPVIQNFRKNIWEFLFEDFKNYREDVIQVINTYLTQFNIRSKNDAKHRKVIWTIDIESLTPFIEANFNIESYKECKVVQSYLKQLEKLDITYPKLLKDKFTNHKIKLASKLNQDLVYGKHKYDLSENSKFLKEDGGTDWDAIELQKYEELKRYTSKYSLEDYKILWEDINEILLEDGRTSSIKSSFIQILKILAVKDINIFLKVLEHVFDSFIDDNFVLLSGYHYLTQCILEKLNKNHRHFFNLINKYDSKIMLSWKFAFFRHLESQYVDLYYQRELLISIHQIEEDFFFSSFNFLSKYNISSEDNLLLQVTSILLEKTETIQIKISFGRGFISDNTSYFKNDLKTLKKVYYSNYDANHHYDHNGTEMEAIYRIDSNFIMEFMDKFYDSNNIDIRELPLHKFRFIWDSSNYSTTLNNLIEFAKNHTLYIAGFEHFLNSFFVTHKPENKKKQLLWIKSYITKNSTDKKAIRLLFNVITYSFLEKRLEFLKLFLEKNQDSTIFKSLELKKGGVFTGSRIPIIEGEIEFAQQIEEVLNSFENSYEFIQHKLIIKDRIKFLKKDIEWEKKREFESYYQ